MEDGTKNDRRNFLKAAAGTGLAAARRVAGHAIACAGKHLAPGDEIRREGGRRRRCDGRDGGPPGQGQQGNDGDGANTCNCEKQPPRQTPSPQPFEAAPP